MQVYTCMYNCTNLRNIFLYIVYIQLRIIFTYTYACVCVQCISRQFAPWHTYRVIAPYSLLMQPCGKHTYMQINTHSHINTHTHTHTRILTRMCIFWWFSWLMIFFNLKRTLKPRAIAILARFLRPLNRPEGMQNANHAIVEHVVCCPSFCTKCTWAFFLWWMVKSVHTWRIDELRHEKRGRLHIPAPGDHLCRREDCCTRAYPAQDANDHAAFSLLATNLLRTCFEHVQESADESVHRLCVVMHQTYVHSVQRLHTNMRLSYIHATRINHPCTILDASVNQPVPGHCHPSDPEPQILHAAGRQIPVRENT